MEAVCGSSPLTVAVYQYACRDEGPAERLDRLEQVAAGCSADLLVCPELYLSGYDVGPLAAERAEPRDGPSLRRLSEIAQRTGVALVCGYPERDGARLYNAAAAFGPDGALLANHRKLRQPNAFEKATFATGERVTAFDLAGWRIGIAICYDVEFPEIARATARAGAALITAPTATGFEWTVVSRRLVPVRAFENGCYVAYANYAGEEGGTRYLGESVIARPDGEPASFAEDAEIVIHATLDPDAIAAARARLPYLKDAETLSLR